MNLYAQCWKCRAPTRDGDTLCNGGLFCAPQFFVYEGDILRAAQSTFYGALEYMKPGRVIVTERRLSNWERDAVSLAKGKTLT